MRFWTSNASKERKMIVKKGCKRLKIELPRRYRKLRTTPKKKSVWQRRELKKPEPRPRSKKKRSKKNKKRKKTNKRRKSESTKEKWTNN